MAAVHDWIEDKVKDALTQGEKKSYYHLLPQRNPNDPVDAALREGATRMVGAINPEAYRENLTAERAGLNERWSSALPGSNFVGALNPEAFRTNLESSRADFTGRRRGFAPPEAINFGAPANPTMAEALDAARRAGVLPTYPQAVSLDERFGKPTPATPAAIPPKPEAAISPVVVGGGGGGGYGNANGAAKTSSVAPLPSEAIPSIYNELNKWDLARGLRNAGIEVPQMSREEMIAALTPKPGQSGLVNVGTMTDDQLRDLMDRRGLNYFKMPEAQMRSLYAPIEKQSLAKRPQALFTGGDFGAMPAAAGPPNYDQAINTGLRMIRQYAKNPEVYGPHFLNGAITLISQATAAREAGPNAEAMQEYHRGMGEYGKAHAALIPSEIEKNLTYARHTEKAGKQMAVPVAPGYQLYVPNEPIGAPWQKVAEGATEKPAVQGMERISQGDKIMLQGAWHALANEMDPNQRKVYQGIIDTINNKYSGGAFPKPKSRQEVFDAIKGNAAKSGQKVTDAQINAYIDQNYPELGPAELKKEGKGGVTSALPFLTPLAPGAVALYSLLNRNQ